MQLLMCKEGEGDDLPLLKGSGKLVEIRAQSTTGRWMPTAYFVRDSLGVRRARVEDFDKAPPGV